MRWLRRIQSFLHRDRLNRELAEELEFHIQMRAKELREEGTPPEEAIRAARRQFGNRSQAAEDIHRLWGFRRLDELLQDLNYALRTFRRNPAFTTIAVLSIGLGIGGNTAIFSLLYGILMLPLPVQNADAVVTVNLNSGAAPRGIPGISVWYPDPYSGFTVPAFHLAAFEALEADHPGLAHVFAFSGYAPGGDKNVVFGGRAELMRSLAVTGDYFTGLGVTPAAGRLIDMNDDRPGVEPVVMISYGVWTDRFGASTTAIGSTIEIDNHPATVIGVLPAGFFGPGYLAQYGPPPDLYVVMRSEASQMSTNTVSMIEIGGTLEANVSVDEASSKMQHLLRAFLLDPEALDSGSDLHILLKPAGKGSEALQAELGEPVFVLMGLAGMILLIACANLANLLLARSAFRGREIAVRLSLGASRWRVARQALTENLLLALLGGGFGVCIGIMGSRVLRLLLVGARGNVRVPGGVIWPLIAAGFAMAILTGLVFGIGPALRAAKTDPLGALKSGSYRGTYSTSHRSYFGLAWNHFLIAAQVAISVVLLVIGALFAVSFVNVTSVPLGFQEDRILLFSLGPQQQAGLKGPALSQFYQDLQRRFLRIPGVSNVTFSVLPMSSGAWMPVNAAVPGEAFPQAGAPSNLHAGMRVATSFFSTMGVSLRSGRSISARDIASGASVAVVNERFVEQHFDSGNPLGRHIQLSFPLEDNTPSDFEIVGVVENAKDVSIKRGQYATAYIPYTWDLEGLAAVTYEIRVTDNPIAIVPAARRILQDINSRTPMYGVKTQAELVRGGYAQEQALASLGVGFGLFGAAVCCVGIYGTVAYTVSRRRRDIGIRMALGSSKRNVAWNNLRQAVVPALVGIGIGLPVALAGSRIVQALLFGLAADDPRVLASACSALILAVIVAALLPAWNATCVDPMVALRDE